MTPFETTTISQTVLLPAKPVQIYDVFVNPAKHQQFTGAAASGEHRPGAAFSAYDGFVSGTHIALERGRRILQDWRTAEWPLDCPPSRLDLRFLPKDGGTEILMEHSGVPIPLAEACRKGWYDYYWFPLLEYFEKHQTSLGDLMTNYEQELNDMILAGKVMDAFEKFYADDVVMEENTSFSCAGKDANRKRELEFFDSVQQFHGLKLLGAALNGDTGYSEWEYEITFKNAPGPIKLTQVAARRWKDGKVIHERFYYDSAKK